jgi:hypothetical protein
MGHPARISPRQYNIHMENDICTTSSRAFQSHLQAERCTYVVMTVEHSISKYDWFYLVMKIAILGGNGWRS